MYGILPTMVCFTHLYWKGSLAAQQIFARGFLDHLQKHAVEIGDFFLPIAFYSEEPYHFNSF